MRSTRPVRNSGGAPGASLLGAANGKERAALPVAAATEHSRGSGMLAEVRIRARAFCELVVDKLQRFHSGASLHNVVFSSPT
jgi:hypothetical protein